LYILNVFYSLLCWDTYFMAIRKNCILVTCLIFALANNGYTKAPKKEGLHIIKARYGACGKWIDVTSQLRGKIKDNRLSIMASNDIAGEPIYGTNKSLYAEYILNNKRGTAQVREGSILEIPPNPNNTKLQPVGTSKALTDTAKSCPATVGFYGINLSTGKTVEHNPDKPACLASIVKIFVLLEVIKQNEAGELDLSKRIKYQKLDKKINCNIIEALDKMIGESDNEATNALAALVGYDKVNALSETLGINGLSNKILPEPGILAKVLDERIYKKRDLAEADLLAQHGTARAITKYFQLLNDNKLINKNISRKVARVFKRNPKNFAAGTTPLHFSGFGKGGSILWLRPGAKEYNMVGWAMLIKDKKTAITFCLWLECFPDNISDEENWLWRHTISDSIVKVLLK
jgi:Beta-lactamase enzyme family